MKKIYSLSI